MVNGSVPNSLVNERRSVSPPWLMCTVWRIVMGAEPSAVSFFTETGEAAQVPIQRSCACAVHPSAKASSQRRKVLKLIGINYIEFR
jgi:hypothetical protein